MKSKTILGLFLCNRNHCFENELSLGDKKQVGRQLGVWVTTFKLVDI